MRLISRQELFNGRVMLLGAFQTSPGPFHSGKTGSGPADIWVSWESVTESSILLNFNVFPLGCFMFDVGPIGPVGIFCIGNKCTSRNPKWLPIYTAINIHPNYSLW